MGFLEAVSEKKSVGQLIKQRINKKKPIQRMGFKRIYSMEKTK
jgi:hypothetical protein